MKKKQVWTIILALLFCLSIAAGCSSKSVSQGNSGAIQDGVAPSTGESASGKDASSGTSTDILIYGKDTDRKLIYTVNMNIDTYEFEADYAKLLSNVSSMGGYVYSEYTYGTKPTEYGDAGRQSTLAVKIPVENLENFLASLEKDSKVVSKTMQVQDTTDQYYDTETRITLLETQYGKLEGYLKEAKTVEDMLNIQKEMTGILQELDTLKGQIRNLDNQITYSTVTIYLQELVRAENVSTSTTSLGERIKEAFSSSIKGLGVFFEGFAVVFAGALPVLAILGAIAAIVVIIVKAASKSKKKAQP